MIEKWYNMQNTYNYDISELPLRPAAYTAILKWKSKKLAFQTTHKHFSHLPN